MVDLSASTFQKKKSEKQEKTKTPQLHSVQKSWARRNGTTIPVGEETDPGTGAVQNVLEIQGARGCTLATGGPCLSWAGERAMVPTQETGMAKAGKYQDLFAVLTAAPSEWSR